MQPHSARPTFGWYYWPARDMNIFIVLVIVLCGVSHLVQTIKARRALRRSRRRQYTRLHHQTESSYDRNKSRTSTQQHRSALYCYSVELGNWLYLAIFPKWMYAPESLADAIWSGLYCGVLSFYCYYRTPSIRMCLTFLKPLHCRANVQLATHTRTAGSQTCAASWPMLKPPSFFFSLSRTIRSSLY